MIQPVVCELCRISGNTLRINHQTSRRRSLQDSSSVSHLVLEHTFEAVGTPPLNNHLPPQCNSRAFQYLQHQTFFLPYRAYVSQISLTMGHERCTKKEYFGMAYCQILPNYAIIPFDHELSPSSTASLHHVMRWRVPNSSPCTAASIPTSSPLPCELLGSAST